jgi:D-xylose transport system substrate-binding protein
MKNNRLFIYFVLMLVLGLTFSCSSEKSYKIGYLYPAKTRPRFVKEGQFLSERISQLGGTCLMVDAEDNDALQVERGIKMLDEGVELLFIAPVNGNTIAPLVREAKKRGVPVIAYNRLINNVDYDMYSTGDNRFIAQAMCETALKAYPRGNYVILAGDRFDRNGIELRQAIDSIMKPHIENGNVNLVYESYIENWAPENAMYEMEQVFQSHGTDIDVVITCYDGMAQGVIKLLKQYGLDKKVVVTGQDAELEAVKSVDEGTQHITIYHPHKVIGYKAAELAFEILNGKNPRKLATTSTFNGFKMIPTFQVKSVRVTKDDIGKELVETGEYTWEQINQ